jgi:hypothetical protein
MEIIKQSPKKWKIYQDVKTGIIHSGYDEIGTLSMWGVKREYTEDGERWVTKWPRDSVPYELKPIDNIIFHARIKPVKVTRGRSSALVFFEDRDHLHKYHTGLAGTMAIMKGVADEVITAKAGYLVGLWTFKKQGNGIYIFPAQE